MQVVTLESPAKVNLGLEILGRRLDGYHEIRTVMVRISLADTLRVGLVAEQLQTSPPLPGVDQNLIDVALDRYRTRVDSAPEMCWSLDKRIPVAGGLGGASSNAATALLAANRLHRDALGSDELSAIAADLGSDIPFFLGSPAAVASGRGTTLSPLVAPGFDLLLVVPHLSIAAKTATLYSLLEPGDFSDGAMIAQTARSLERRELPAREGLGNAFQRALCTIDPRISDLQQAMESLGLTWALSGAGPTHYVIIDQAAHAAVRQALSSRFPDWIDFHSAQTVPSTGALA